ncbi:putative Rho-type GTPase-activating protein 4 [Zalerion maritima]|uniref:Rho-type GTPase-activating protein 4 n=1 Tax=Zalerion maritima TaxID=339359 RepID=A0AAD5RRT6_9PEZI|nr:putative Rho-type GTPase-activating protein 4 [Zalerion maritima]
MDDYLDSPMDSDDVFPCKGCGEILEEGKAFELAGNRWHLNCFRCNTCGTLLDSDANLLLLGDGSLICNNCTYSCSACGNKIEDLAILTGDQAFCATCFRCRNCKRKIENLRYARTSQGIFCMSCHESLMARRRKKSKAAQQAKAREKEASPMITDKSLPALPPNAVPPNAFSNDRVSPESDTPTELSPRPRPAYGRNDSSSRSSSRPARSPERPSDARESGLSLPTKSYRNNRNSSIVTGSDGAGLDSESFLIPVALDPSPAPTATPRSTSENFGADVQKTKEKDYFSVSRPVEKASATPHIAFQEKGRQPSSDYESSAPPPPARRLSKVSTVESTNNQAKEKSSKGEDFRLQEAPKSKRSPKTDQSPPFRKDSLRNTSQTQIQTADKTGTPRSSQDSRPKDDENNRPSIDSASLPPRIDSQKAISRKELPHSAGRNLNGKSVAPPRQSSEDRAPQPPPTSGYQSLHSRPGLSEQKLSDTYMQPRAPPAPPGGTHAPKESVSSTNDPPSPKLPRWSAGGDFSMDEDMARILGTDEGSSSILRRVSNAVRHGRTNSSESTIAAGRHTYTHARSVSETTKGAPSPRWPKTPGEDHNGHAQDISSPISLASSDDPAFLKRQLRNSEQRVVELERQFKSEKDLKNLNKKLVEKRKTVSELDTQTELLVQQLEVLSGLVEKAKTNQQAIDLKELEDSAIKDFMQRLDKLKHRFSIEFEQMVAARDELEEQRNQAMSDRDRALVEFEQLSTKNAQLADLNNDLTHQIQERFKAQIVTDPRSPNGLGLGLISQPRGNMPPIAVLPDNASYQTGTTVVSNDTEDTVLEPGLAAVKIGKGQVKKFNWKKGTSRTMQSVAKGVKGAVVAFQNQQQERGVHGGIDAQSIGMPYEATRVQVDSPISHAPPNGQQTRRGQEQARQGFGGFFKGRGPQDALSPLPKSMSNANIAVPAADASITLFGSDLSERADYERRQIPCVVTRCIEEVELRGMDIEGIYRKSGGNSQNKMVQEGFDKSEDYDISDPSIDIASVTSVLKQYFRRLPIPLLAFDVYDRILESNAIDDETERIEFLTETFNSLPEKHKDCLEFLMFHLARVAQREPENLMSPKNLAVVFAPTIMRDKSIEREMTDMHAKNLAVQFMIEHSDKIFES